MICVWWRLSNTTFGGGLEHGEGQLILKDWVVRIGIGYGYGADSFCVFHPFLNYNYFIVARACEKRTTTALPSWLVPTEYQSRTLLPLLFHERTRRGNLVGMSVVPM